MLKGYSIKNKLTVSRVFYGKGDGWRNEDLPYIKIASLKNELRFPSQSTRRQSTVYLI